jgi:polysaccharide pyruvyl transferase WcaK-like protein
MKILLIGEQYSNNLGDQLLCQTVEKILKERYPTFEYISYDLSGRKKKMEKESVLIQKGKNVLRLSKKFRKIENYMLIKHGIERIVSTQKIDAAVFVGGEVFMDFFADKMSVILKALYKKRIKVIRWFDGQIIGC